MKCSLILASALAAVVSARNCQKGLMYCGSTLQSIATGTNYNAQILAAWQAYNGPAMRNTNLQTNGALNALYECTGGSNGDIYVYSTCNTGRCLDEGSNKSDICYTGQNLGGKLRKRSVEGLNKFD